MSEKKPSRAIHHVKCHPHSFSQTRERKKDFEVRLDDRGYAVGDVLVMHEWDPERAKVREAEGYTGPEVRGTIACIVANFAGLAPGYVVLGVKWTEGLFPTSGSL